MYVLCGQTVEAVQIRYPRLPAVADKLKVIVPRNELQTGKLAARSWYMAEMTTPASHRSSMGDRYSAEITPLGKLLRPSSGLIESALHAGVPSAFHSTLAPPGQQRAMKSGRGLPTWGRHQKIQQICINTLVDLVN